MVCVRIRVYACVRVRVCGSLRTRLHTFYIDRYIHVSINVGRALLDFAEAERRGQAFTKDVHTAGEKKSS